MGSQWREQAGGAALGLWMVDVERGFVGAAPPPELSGAILALVRRTSSSEAVHSEAVHTEDVLLAPERGGDALTVRLLARPASRGLVAVASHALGARTLADEAAWIERYRQMWAERFDALDTVVQELKQREKDNERDTK